ncbi:MAG: spore cortex biosynthesis protein YabQ [Oscillospiraceae bacterium]|nr:spore cortex biosynthesis protein YabQ [Oscillospiraceae bacterium]
MNFGAFSAADALSDAFLSLGLAVVISFFYQLALSRPPRSKALSFAAHALFFIPAGALVFCFIAGATQAKEPRWYLFAGGAAGVFAYIKCFSGLVGGMLAALRRFIRRLLSPLLNAFARTAGALQRRAVSVYNQLAAKRAEKAEKSGEENGLENAERGSGKEPRKPYTQT